MLHALVRQVHTKPLRDDVGQEARAQKALVDHACRTWRGPRSPAAVAAAVLLLRDLVHERQLDAQEFVAHVLADLLHLTAALAAELIFGQLVGRAYPRQVRRQLLTSLARLVARLRRRDLDRAVCAGCFGSTVGFFDDLSQPEVLLAHAGRTLRKLAVAALLRAPAERDDTEDLDVVLELANQLVACSQMLFECSDPSVHLLDFTRVRSVHHARHDLHYARTVTVAGESLVSADRSLRSASTAAHA